MTDECFKAKQWLRRVYVITKRVESNDRMLEVLKDRVNSATAKYENTGEGIDREQAQKRREDALYDYIEQQGKCDRSRRLLAKETRKVKKVIKKIDDEVLADVIEYRYVKLLAWSDVADVIAYSQPQTYRFHARALEKVAKILREEGRFND